MTRDYFIQWFEYNCWANRKVWDCVTQLSEEKFHEKLDYSIGSIYWQVVHTAAVESWWFYFLKTGELDFLDPDKTPLNNYTEIRAEWDKIEEMVRGYLQTLTPEELEREVRPPFWEEDKQPIKVWQATLQVMNHSTDHRAQTLAGLHKLGAPTVAQDVLDFLWAQQKALKQT